MRRISCACALFATVGSLLSANALVAQITATKVTFGNTAIAAAPLTTESELVRGWYRDYLGREPGPELSAWVQLLRGGMSAIDVQATVLGSDEYFDHQGRDPQTFVLETLQAVTWQAPSSALLRQWNDRLTSLRGDRFALAREILIAYSTPQSTAGQASEISLRLTNAAKLLQDTADFELSGTTQGRQAALRARSLYDASMTLQRTVGIRNYRLDDVLNAARGVESSYNAVQATLNNPPGTAPSASAIARRIDGMLNDLQVALQPQYNPGQGGNPPGPTYPSPNTPSTPPTTGVGYDQNKLQRQIESVARGTQSLVQLFSSQPSGNYTYRVLLTDLNSFASQIDALETSVGRGTSLQRLQWEYQTLRNQAERLRPQLLNGNPPTFTRLFWTSVESSLDQMRETLGMAANGNPGTVPPLDKPNVDLVAICDSAVGHTDAFLTGLSPYVFGIPEVPRLQRDLRTVRNQVLTIRQMIVQQSPALQIEDQLRLARLQYDAAYEMWSGIVDGYKLENYTKLSPVGRTLTALEEGITGKSSGTNVYLRPDTSRVATLIATFDQELTKYQSSLQAFQQWTEYRSLGLFVEQLAGYSKSLKELEVDRARNLADEQRLIAGMQRVMELFDSYNTRLEERANTSTDRNALTYALELRRSIGRLSNLINDLEHEVR